MFVRTGSAEGNSLAHCLMFAAVLAAVSAASFLGLSALLSCDDERGIDFALATTSASQRPGGTVAVVPLYGIGADAVAWESSDESVAVVRDGVVTILPGASEGDSATVTATLGSSVRPVEGSLSAVRSGSASCLIRVGAPLDGTNVYNLASENYDYAVINRSSADASDGFKSGLLSAEFNASGNMVITLSGYDPNWLDRSPRFIGNPLNDFKNVTFTVKDSGGSTVASSTYTASHSIMDLRYDPVNGIWTVPKISDYDSVLVVVDRDDLSTGETYNVSVAIEYEEIKYGRITSMLDISLSTIQHLDTVSGTLEYHPGDRTTDASGTVHRQHAFRHGGDTYSFRTSFPYCEYLSYHAKNLKDFHRYPASGTDMYRNYASPSEVLDYIRGSGVIDSIAKELRAQYVAKHAVNEDVSTDPDYADFLLAYVQIRHSYCYDSYQYLSASDAYRDVTDYFAYPVETVYSGLGDCDDTSILMAAVFRAAGYTSGVTLLPGHAIASVAIRGFSGPADVANGCGIRAQTETLDGDEMTFYGCETSANSHGKYRVGVISDSPRPYATVGYEYGLFVPPGHKFERIPANGTATPADGPPLGTY